MVSVMLTTAVSQVVPASSIANLTLDDLYKIVLAVVPLLALILTPYIQYIIAKRQTNTQQQIAKRQIADSISSRRQVWIDELRRDASEFLTLIGRLEELKRPASNLCEEDQKKNFDEKAAANARAHELAIRIKLRLNPFEEEHNKLVQLLNALGDVCIATSPNETDEQEQLARSAFHKATNEVVSHIQSILKHEWERVKRGDV